MQTENFTNFWRKTKQVKAIRLNEYNIKLVARIIKGTYWPGVGGEGADGPCITLKDGTGYLGYWVVETEPNRFVFVPDYEFLELFETHSERLSTDEKYAKIFQIVLGAMTAQDAARFHNDSNGEMEILAETATRKILGMM